MSVETFARIPCKDQNHQEMPLEFIYQGPAQHGSGHVLGCLNCVQEYHKDHLEGVRSIVEILHSICPQNDSQTSPLLTALVEGLPHCRDKAQLTSNINEILAMKQQPPRFEAALDQEMAQQNTRTAQFYQRDQLRAPPTSISTKTASTRKPLITPVLTFPPLPNCTQTSPFSITHNSHQQITTVFAQPSLSKYHESTAVRIRVERHTPAWLGIGLSLGQQPYSEQGSKTHSLLISNGWLSSNGQLQSGALRFGKGDIVAVRWDKNMQLLEWEVGGRRQTLSFPCPWSQEVYLCVCLFYRGDRVSIMA